MLKSLQSVCRDIPTPAYVVDERLLRRNLQLLAEVERATGAKILLAQKCFSMYYFYPLIGEYLSGAAASGLYEARLAHEKMKGENHVFSPAYKTEDFAEICRLCDHVIFNSLNQLKKFAPTAKAAGVSCGLRINPEHSTQNHAIYDPCAPGSRLGVRRAELEEADFDFLSLIDGFHFHTLCEQNADALASTLHAVENKFGEYLPKLKWLNFGGGHHITRSGYDLKLLKKCICQPKDKYDLQIYLEPGEAVALNVGFLAATVLDVRPDGNVIIDASAACHMPDVLEMPYRPKIVGTGNPGEKNFTYRLGAATCLAGDVIGEYSFDRELQEGERIFFEDMAIYTMVKNNTFNGMPLPVIAVIDESGAAKAVKRFSYDDFVERLS